jgi:hydroxymethylpyrimidine pyrophosphatase-like HAD family hydrolase
MWVFVDVDGTLIDIEDNPRPHIPEFILKLKELGCTIVIWSGGGADYAEQKFNAICNRLYWSKNPNWNLQPHIRTYLEKWNFEDAALILKDFQFYVDDVQSLLDNMAKKGHGTFKVPFYMDPAIADLADKNDRWLLKAVEAIERDLHERCGGPSDPEHGEDSTALPERPKESPDRQIIEDNAKRDELIRLTSRFAQGPEN